MRFKIGLLVLSYFLFNIVKAQGLENDKLLHAAAGFGISAVAYTVVKASTDNKKKALLWSFITSTAAGIAKELVDSGEEGNKFDGVDALATTAGGVVGGFTMHIILDKKKKKPKKVDEAELQRELFFAIEASN